jgi:hypothetical protein
MSNEAKLGTTPNGTEGRDALHVAIVPCRASVIMRSGDPVKVGEYGMAELCNPEEAVGVVDPFLPSGPRLVEPGDWFWLCLYPKTITGLRHVWEHPSFKSGDSAAAETKDAAKSVEWIRHYVRSHCPYNSNQMDEGYSEFLNSVVRDREIFFCGSNCHSIDDVDDSDELFRHLSVVTGMKIDRRYFVGFSCTC